ncbi:MAG: lysylphosphatidylglycerol synthase transmembrane domain-containing protein [Paracoccaceae bacterium]
MGKTWLKIAVSIAVLVGVFMVTDTNSIVERLKTADLSWLGVALLCLTALTFLMAKRWQLTARSLDIELSYGRAVREYYLAQLINLIVPGGVAGDATRAVRLRKEGDLIRTTQSVVLERLIGQIVMFGLMFTGFVCALVIPGGLAWPSWVWAVLSGGAIAFTLGAQIGKHKAAVAKFLRLLGQCLRDPKQIILSTIIAFVVNFSFYACAKATGTALPISTLFTLIPLILSSMLIPLSVGGWGWREGAAAALFPLAGASASAGIATGIAYGAMMLVAALPAVVLIALPNSKTQTKFRQLEYNP